MLYILLLLTPKRTYSVIPRIIL